MIEAHTLYLEIIMDMKKTAALWLLLDTPLQLMGMDSIFLHWIRARSHPPNKSYDSPST